MTLGVGGKKIAAATFHSVGDVIASDTRKKTSAGTMLLLRLS